MAKEILQVVVNEQDIEYGIEGSQEQCPIALALARLQNEDWEVDGTRASFYVLSGKGFYYELPEVARKFTSDFDKYLEVKPFSFQLHLDYQT